MKNSIIVINESEVCLICGGNSESVIVNSALDFICGLCSTAFMPVVVGGGLVMLAGYMDKIAKDR